MLFDSSDYFFNNLKVCTRIYSLHVDETPSSTANEIKSVLNWS